MPRWLLTLLGATLLLSLVVATVYALGILDTPLARMKLALSRTAYQSTAERIVREEAPTAQDRTFVYSPVSDDLSHLVDGRVFYYVRVDQDEFVYFDLHDDVTMSSGLVYSASGATPPNPPVSAATRLDAHWFSVTFENAHLEYGRLDK